MSYKYLITLTNMPPNLIGVNNFVNALYTLSPLTNQALDFPDLKIERFYSCGVEDFITVAIPPSFKSVIYCYLKLPCVIDVGLFLTEQNCNNAIGFTYALTVDGDPQVYSDFPMNVINDDDYITL